MRKNELRKAKEACRRSPAALSLLIVISATLSVCALLDGALRLRMLPAGPAEAHLLALSTVAVAALAWYYVARPFERVLRETRRTLRSLFVENPEAIAIYDLNGCVVRGNRAAVAMMKQPSDSLIGAHFTTHMAPESIAAANEAFKRVALGGTVEFETVFLGNGGERIEVRTTGFPHIIDGSVAALFGVAKDIGELKRSQAAYKEQAQRIAELYRISSAVGSTWKKLIEEALLLTRQRLGFEDAYLIEVGEGDQRLVVCSSDRAESRLDLSEPIRRFVQTVLERGELVSDHDGADPSVSLVGSPVRLSAAAHAVVIFVPEGRTQCVLTPPDCDFVRLVTTLIASAIERGEQQERLDQLAFFDALTGLPNRVMVSDRLAELLGSSEWANIPFAVHYVDLDRFKAVNDEFGHAVGDQILRLASRRMQDAVTSTDMVARLGGDEFVVVQPLLDGHAFAEALAMRILSAIAQPFLVDGTYHQLAVSIGISISPNHGRDSVTLLRRADEALYRAKREGRNRLEFAYGSQSVAT